MMFSGIFGGGNTIGKTASAIKDSQKKQDAINFDMFKNQDFLDIEKDLYLPTYRRSPHLQKEQEAMLSLFNARKDQVLDARRMPGINQTRF